MKFKVTYNGETITIVSKKFTGSREEMETLATALGWFNFSDRDARRFRAEPPYHRNYSWPTNGRNRTTLPDFKSLGEGAWDLWCLFDRRPAGDVFRDAFFMLIDGANRRPLFDSSAKSWEVGQRIVDAALSVIEPASRAGFL